MRIVLDTNVLLAALPKVSRFRAIITALFSEKFELVVSTAILLEYQEILSRKTNTIVANNFLEFLTKLPGVVRVDTPFTWGIIEVDPDDNKFVDGALACNADYIVTNDGYFNILKTLPFPRVNVISAEEFLALLSSVNS